MFNIAGALILAFEVADIFTFWVDLLQHSQMAASPAKESENAVDRAPFLCLVLVYCVKCADGLLGQGAAVLSEKRRAHLGLSSHLSMDAHCCQDVGDSSAQQTPLTTTVPDPSTTMLSATPVDTMSASKKRSEARRRKLLLNSEERMNRIMGYKDAEDLSSSKLKLEQDKQDVLLISSVTKRGSTMSGDIVTNDNHSGLVDTKGTLGERMNFGKSSELNDNNSAVRLRSRVDLTSTDSVHPAPRHGLNQYLSRFDEAMKLRNQLISEKPSPENGSTAEEFDSFRIFRLVGSALLAIVVRMFVCKYLSVFAPFLTLQLAFMGLSKYFPKGEKKMKTTVLTAALLLSGIPSELINRSMDTYSKMGDVFTDLCVYFFTFIFCHEVLYVFGSDVP